MTLVTLREDTNVGKIGQQTHTFRGVYWLNGRSVRVHINYDASYRQQTTATVELWANDKWNNVVDMIGSQIPRYHKSTEVTLLAGLHQLSRDMLDEAQDVMQGGPSA